MKLSQGIPGIVALPSVHPHLLGSWFESKVAPYVPLQHIHWMVPAPDMCSRSQSLSSHYWAWVPIAGLAFQLLGLEFTEFTLLGLEFT